MALLTGMPLAEIGTHVLVGIALFVLGFALFSFGVFGGGDAKLLAAAGLWFGSAQLVPFLVSTAIVGGLLAAGVAIWSVISMSWEIHDAPLAGRIKLLKPNVPYGYAFAVGAILAFPQSWWMVQA
jgi:prepilin peptidase CpaA